MANATEESDPEPQDDCVSGSSNCSTVHPRVLELMRDRIGVGRDLSNQELADCTQGSFLHLACCVQHAKEEVIKVFALIGKRLLTLLSR